jgi:hypothetical protein
MSHNQDGQRPNTRAGQRTDSQAVVPARPNRRGFFHACFALMTAIAAFIVAFPVFSFFRLPKRIRTVKKIEVPLAGLSRVCKLSWFTRTASPKYLIRRARIWAVW